MTAITKTPDMRSRAQMITYWIATALLVAELKRPGIPEAPDLGNEDAGMPTESSSGKKADQSQVQPRGEGRRGADGACVARQHKK